MMEESKLRERIQRISDLVRRLDGAPDQNVRVQVRELLQSVMDLHGEALGRMLERIGGVGDAGSSLVDSFAADPVISSVLVLYGLHPVDFESRVRAALDSAHSALRAQGAIAELISSSEGDVRVRIRGVGDAATACAVRAILEDELYAAAPDASSVVLSGLEKFSSPDFVPLEQVGVLAAGRAADPA